MAGIFLFEFHDSAKTRGSGKLWVHSIDSKSHSWDRHELLLLSQFSLRHPGEETVSSGSYLEG